MKVHDNLTKAIFFFPYYLLHRNIFLGFLYKKFFSYFEYKNIKIFIKKAPLMISEYSSFVFKTYEFNDRYLIEKYLNKKNKCIVIGAGPGFTSCLCYEYSRNPIKIFEIDKRWEHYIVKSIKINKVKAEVYFNNLTFSKNKIFQYFYINKFGLWNNQEKNIDSKKTKIKNIYFNRIKKINDFNTLVIDAEGYEYYIVRNLHLMKNIKYIIFEFHNNLFDSNKKDKFFNFLKINHFKLQKKFFNSYYYEKLYP